MSTITILKKEYKRLLEVYELKYKTKKVFHQVCIHCKKAKPDFDFTIKGRPWCIYCRRIYQSTYQKKYYAEVGRSKRQELKKSKESSDEEEEVEPKKRKSRKV